MSVRGALLTLLAGGPKYGYQLKSEFEEATGTTWALNIGQVYTTLQRLERDSLVEPVDSADDEGRISYNLTAAGRDEVERWLRTPSSAGIASRDEATMRILLSLATGAAPVHEVLAAQRDAAMETLQTLTALRTNQPSGTEPLGDLPWRLQLDRMLFLAEAELRWLERAEERLAAGGVAEQPRSGADDRLKNQSDNSRSRT